MKNTKGLLGICILAMILLGSCLHAQQTPATAPPDIWKFLIGDWVGEGGGDPGQGTGWFTFSYDLQQKIIVRKNHTEYPATKDRPATTHDDLMIVYPDANKKSHAIYFDSEGHVINYELLPAADGNLLVFLSDATAPGPRFRLTYTKSGDKAVKILFEMATPDKPDTFVKYIEAGAHKK